MDNLIESVIKGEKEDLIIEDNEFIYQITSTENQNNNKYNEISSIKLGDCENKLKKYYNISKDEPLLISKIDFYKGGLLIPIIEYEVYDTKAKTQLDLSICIDTKINLLLPADINEKEEFKHNKSSEYYNDICYTFTTDLGTDITLADRKSEFNNNNMSVCEVNCDYEGYISDEKKAKCECQVKIKIPLISEIVFNKDQLLNNFVDINNTTNFKVMKCVNIVFSKEGLKNNIGNYSILSVILIIITNNILFIFKGFKLLCDIIDKIFENKININNISNNIENKNKNKIITKKIEKDDKKISMNFNNLEINKNENEINNSNPPPPKRLNFLKTNNDDEITTGKISELKIMKNQNLINNDKKRIINIIKIENLYIHNINVINYNYKYYNDYELNTLTYKEAIKIDKRNYF